MANGDYGERIDEQRDQAKSWAEMESLNNITAEEEQDIIRDKAEERSFRRRNRKHRKPIKISLMAKTILFSLGPLLVMGLVVTIYTIITMKMSLNNEKLSSLTNFAISVRGSIENSTEGSLNLKDGVVYIGDDAIGSNKAYLDAFSNEGQVQLSIYYGDKAYVTTFKDASGNRLSDITMDETAKTEVFANNKVYATDKAIINGVKYCGVYLPLRDGSKVVGALFAGQPRSDIDSVVNKQIISLATIAGAILLIAVIIVSVSSVSMARSIKDMEESLTALADGYLSIIVKMNVLTRNDELGTMGRALQNTAKRMSDIVHETNSSIRRLVRAGDNLEDSSEQTSESARGISSVVEEISKGAVSQAADVDRANHSVVQMGEGITSIVDSLDCLKECTEDMLRADRESEVIIEELVESGEQTARALAEVNRNVLKTSHSAAKISEAVSIITNIAEETSLLSLNASIEAARAGESGRGFSVVAIQIQKLADESTKSAERIAEVIAELTADSQASVAVMKQMASAIEEQQKKLEVTRKHFAEVTEGINSTLNETEIIYGQSQNCARERENVLDIIQNLSSISEANASSAESTSGAMLDLNDTINVVADSSKNLQKIAQQLEENVKFFKL